MAVDQRYDFLFCTRRPTTVLELVGLPIHYSSSEPDGVFRFQGGNGAAEAAAQQHASTYHALTGTLMSLMLQDIIRLNIGVLNYGIRTGYRSGLLYYPGSSVSGQSTDGMSDF